MNRSDDQRERLANAATPLPPARTGELERTDLDARTPAEITGRVRAQSHGFGEGSVIGQYEIIRELGRGGMGQVLLARDTKLGRRVAIKLLAKVSASLATRFLNEARTTAQLTHENIVVIHEVNEHAATPYMVLEYLEGEPLTNVIREGGIPWARAVEICVPIVRALVRAHELGIIHRDLKPDNVFLTSAGLVKVLDFGIAKAFSDGAPRPEAVPSLEALGQHDVRLTQEGAIVGTLPYMSPEQCGMDEVDHRTDLWALGLILFELLAGRHPLAPLTPERLFRAAAKLDEPMPSIVQLVPELPEALVRAVDGCLRKPKGERIGSARELLALLEPLMPGQLGRQLAEGESPYPGLAAFQETDAARFFGRGRDVVKLIARLRDQPLVGVVGPSGVGKSSFVRAGVIPALKATGEAWEAFVIRPGRDPIAALASLLHPLTASSSSDLSGRTAEHEDLRARLRTEPGYLGTVLRSRARHKNHEVLLFIDQFEELYTLVPSQADRMAFTDAIAGVADDSATPLRVVVSMRSDFLDRVAENAQLMEDLTRGLMFLAPPDRNGLREALVQPLELAGYRFETMHIVEDMLTTLESTPGSLPLLQFVAARLWDARDRQRRMITAATYDSIGGIAGALAVHADEALSQLAAESQRLARTVFQRLVTPERTRAIVDTADLLSLAANPVDVQRVLDQLVQARLLVVQTRGEAEGATVEIVHESLIVTWPTLRRWLDESQEDAVFIAELQAAAKQWEARDRPSGLLWRGEAAHEAQRWRARSTRELAPREQQFLDAVFALGHRARRIRRFAVIGTIAFLVALVATAAGALVVIADAKEDAQAEAQRATTEAEKARAAEEQSKREADRARDAEEKSKRDAEEARRQQRVADERLRQIEAKDQDIARGKENLDKTYAELQASNKQLQKAVSTADDQRKRAEAAQAKAEAAEKKWRTLYDEKAAQVKKLEKLNRPLD